MVTAANKIKTAAAARPKPNDHQWMGGFQTRHQRRLETAARLMPALLSLRASLPARKALATAALVAAFQFLFKLGKIVHCGCKVFFKLVKAYRYRDAAVFCEIPSAPAISLNVRSFQIFKTSTSR